MTIKHFPLFLFLSTTLVAAGCGDDGGSAGDGGDDSGSDTGDDGDTGGDDGGTSGDDGGTSGDDGGTSGDDGGTSGDDGGTSGDDGSDTGTDTGDTGTDTGTDTGDTGTDTGDTGTDTGDTGTDTGDTGTSGGAGIDPDIAYTADLVGLPTQLDASGSTDGMGGTLSFDWEILSVPNGSSITTSDLSDSSAEQPTFVPDRAGDYQVQLTVSADTRMEMASATIPVQALEIPYFLVTGDDSSSSRAAALVMSDSTGDTQIGCLFNDSATSEEDWLDDFTVDGQFSVDAFYPAQPSQKAQLAYQRYNSMSSMDALYVADRDSDCQGDPAPTEQDDISFPRFSPNGQRIAALGDLGSDVNAVYTQAVDGSDVRIVRTDAAYDLVSPPFWDGNDRIAWIEQIDGENVIYSAPDATDGFDNQFERLTLMDCRDPGDPLAEITQVGLFSGGMIVTVNPGYSNTDTELWLLTPNPDGETFDCSESTNKNSKLTDLSPVSDWELSPDGSTVAFVHFLDDTVLGVGVNASELYMVPSDGSSAETQVVTDDMTSNNAPHWVGNGKQLVWTKTTWEDTDIERPTEANVMIMNADGSNPRVLKTVTTSQTQTRSLTTGSNGCSVDPGAKHLGGALWLLGLGLLGLQRRRNLHARN